MPLDQILVYGKCDAACTVIVMKHPRVTKTKEYTRVLTAFDVINYDMIHHL